VPGPFEKVTGIVQVVPASPVVGVPTAHPPIVKLLAVRPFTAVENEAM
jgi:hypothetical protein